MRTSWRALRPRPEFGQRARRRAFGWQNVGPIHATTPVRPKHIQSLREYVLAQVEEHDHDMAATRKDLARGYLDPNAYMIGKDQLHKYADECAPITWQHDHGQKVHRMLSSLPAAEVSILLNQGASHGLQT